MRDPRAMDAAFRGFAPEVFEWFAGLERDNSKAYFTATRERYETEVRGGLQAMLDELSQTFGGEVKVFRQQRDLRFAPDKSAAVQDAGPTDCCTACRGPGGRPLRGAVRAGPLRGHGLPPARPATSSSASAPPSSTTAPARSSPTLVAAARAGGLEVVGESLRTAPRGYPRDHPRVELLRHKALIAGRSLPGTSGHRPRRGAHHVASAWRAAEPLNAWLDEHVGASKMERR